MRGIVGTNKTQHISLCLSSVEKGSFWFIGLYVKEMQVMHHVPLLVVPVPWATHKHSRYNSTRVRELHFRAGSPVCKAVLGIRSACDLLLHENLPSFNTLNILGKTIVQGQKVLRHNECRMGGEKPLRQMLHLIPTACLGRDVRLYSHSSDVKHLQQHLGPVKIYSKTLMNLGLMPGHENSELCRKRQS